MTTIDALIKGLKSMRKKGVKINKVDMHSEIVETHSSNHKGYKKYIAPKDFTIIIEGRFK